MLTLRRSLVLLSFVNTALGLVSAPGSRLVDKTTQVLSPLTPRLYGIGVSVVPPDDDDDELELLDEEFELLFDDILLFAEPPFAEPPFAELLAELLLLADAPDFIPFEESPLEPFAAEVVPVVDWPVLLLAVPVDELEMLLLFPS
jgi:hypothetical protein